MKGSEARLLTAVARSAALPVAQGPEVVFLGRSNVGKSSLINAIVHRRSLARVSRTPGRTQQILFFTATGFETLVDLPGYGFSRAPRAVRESWKPLVDSYLTGGRPLALCLLLVDSRHEPTTQDVEMMDWLRETRQPVQVVLTIPEGLDSGEIAELAADVSGFSAVRFLAVADSLAERAAVARVLLGPSVSVAVFDSLLGASTKGVKIRDFHWCEGLLAPDTYHFAEGSGPAEVAIILLTTQLDRLQVAIEAAAGGVNGDLTPLALLTLASVVETEARRDDERALIAAVYTNRLVRNWRLEADPTVAFILDKKGDRLFYKDLKVESPYNTYRNKGLPPGPIGTPGLASLMAAAQPDSTCDAMYFVSDAADGHVFTRTAREHEAAVQKFRAARSRDRRGN